MKGYVKIFTYGCQMNDLDSQKLYTLLSTKGWDPTYDTSKADLIILNTCTVRQKAYEKAISNLGRLRHHKSVKPSLIIAITGCIAQQEGKKLLERFRYVNMVVGTHQLHNIPAAVDRIKEDNGHTVDTRFGSYIPSMDIIPDTIYMEPAHRAYINIMQGCNNFCTYCIVPYVRGPEISRSYKSIIEEVRIHAEKGVREIFLLGQNVNSYSGGIAFHQLLDNIHTIDGIERIRFTTSHPKDMNDSLIACFGRLDKLCPHVHLPFQSGSNHVLKAMNRGYTREDYLGLIKKLRSAKKDIAFSSDVIVGFPNETEEDFEQTLDLIRSVRFDVLFSFRYSPRPGTGAFKIKDRVPLEEKKSRLMLLQSIQRKITLENHTQRIGMVFDVLVDGMSKRHKDQVYGRIPHNTVVNFKGSPDLIGNTVKVKITRANPNSLTGELICQM